MSFFIVGLTAAAFATWQNYRDHQITKASELADTATLIRLRSEFPMGTSLADVHAGLLASNLDVHDYNGQIFLRQGTQPSFVWYCGPYTRYVVFSFSPSQDGSSRLKTISREVVGLNCL